jgi:histidinol-phosphate phosphatase family protein
MNRAVFLDRDGVINEMVYNSEFGTVDSPLNPNEFKLLPRVAEAIAKLNRLNFKVIVISNQPAIAKGKTTQANLNAVNQKMVDLLGEKAAWIDRAYYCYHRKEDMCKCRKPNIGLVLEAQKDFDVDLSKSYVVGDSLTDIQTGKRAGCKSIMLGTLKCDLCKYMDATGVKPDLIVPDLYEAVEQIAREVKTR